MKIASLFLLTIATAACSTSADSHTSLTIAVSGEDAVSGFAFPPASPNDPAFVDGWDVRFDRILVTVDAINLAENPDTSPTDQAQTGRVVARASGPWAVDVAKIGVAADLTPRGLRPLDLVHDDIGANPDAQSTSSQP